MKKNTAGQKWRVFAFDRTTNAPKTGDAAAITAQLAKDFATEAALADTNPAEVGGGYYDFDLSQAETNADTLMLRPTSATANIGVVPCPAVIVTSQEHVVKAATDKLDTMVELDGAVYRFTTNALEQAPSGTGGDATEAKQDTIIALLGTPADTDLSTDVAAVKTVVDTLSSGEAVHVTSESVNLTSESDT